MTDLSPPPRHRVVWGYPAMADVLDTSTSRVRWLAGQGLLRIRKHGRRTVSALEHELLEDCAGAYQNSNSK
jgi:hypothetical protein